MTVRECATLAEFLAVEADYYGPPDEERYTATDFEEWLADTWEGFIDEIDEDGVEVVALRKQVVPQNRAEDMADSALAEQLDSLDEQWGDPEGEPTPPSEELRDKMVSLMQELIAEYDVWCLDAVARCTLTADEVRAVLGGDDG